MGGGGGGGGGDQQRNRQANTQALSKLPFGKLPFSFSPKLELRYPLPLPPFGCQWGEFFWGG